MRKRLYKTAAPWILFAAALLMPQLFLLFAPYAAHFAYTALLDEYGEVFEYWGAKLQRLLRLFDRERRPKAKPSRLKAAAEMV